MGTSLQARRVYPSNKFKNNYPRNNLIVNWGNSTQPDWWKPETAILNDFESVSYSVNKLDTFMALLNAQVTIPWWTTETNVAQQWIDEGNRVYGRKTLTGHSGQGIRIFDSETICTPDECPLYTLDTKAKHEYRIHVFKDMIIDQQMKKKKLDHEGGIRGIRNHANGWVYAREGIVFPIPVLEQAIKAVRALGLDFGAVDIGYNEREATAYVYEVNSAPGLHGTTLTKYVEAIGEYYGNLSR